MRYTVSIRSPGSGKIWNGNGCLLFFCVDKKKKFHELMLVYMSVIFE